TPTVLATSTVFPDQEAVPASVAVRLDDAWAAVPEDGFSIGNRLNVFRLDAGVPVPGPVLMPMNPIRVAFPPFDDQAVLITSDGTDAYLHLSLDGGVGASIALTNGSPQLPGPPVMIARGGLKGHVFIGEVDSIRHLAFWPDGGLTDVAKTTIPA